MAASAQHRVGTQKKTDESAPDSQIIFAVLAQFSRMRLLHLQGIFSLSGILSFLQILNALKHEIHDQINYTKSIRYIGFPVVSL